MLRMMLRIFVVAVAIAFLSCAHEQMRADGGYYLPYSRVNPGHYAGLPAVTLLNRFDISFDETKDGGLKVRIKQKKQIQILAESGFSFAQGEAILDNNVNASLIDLHIIHQNGEVTSVLDSEAIEEPVFRAQTIGAALYPDVRKKVLRSKDLQVGDVVEIQKVVEWNDPRWLPPIIINDVLPTKLGQVLIDVPDGILPQFRVMRLMEQVNMKPRIFSSNGKNRYIWLFQNEMALFPLPQQPPAEALATQILMTLGKWPQSRTSPSSFLTWEDLGAWFRNRVAIYDIPSYRVSQKAEMLTKSKVTVPQSVFAIQKFVQNEIYNVEPLPFLTSARPKSADEVLIAGGGLPIDKAVLAHALLRAAGIDGFYVLASSRVGLPNSSTFISPALFQRVLIAVPVGDQLAIIDPDGTYLAYGKVSDEVRKNNVLFVRDRRSAIMDLPNESPLENEQTMIFRLNLLRNGDVAGRINGGLTGLRAVYARRLALVNPIQVAEKLQAWLCPNSLKHYLWRDLVFDSILGDMETPVRFSARIEPVALALQDGENLRIALGRLMGKPFSWSMAKTRATPMVLDGLFSEDVQVVLSLPEEYVPLLGNPVDLATDVLDVSFRKSFSQGQLFVRRSLRLKKDQIAPSDFLDFANPLQALWTAEENETLLQKKLTKTLRRKLGEH